MNFPVAYYNEREILFFVDKNTGSNIIDFYHGIINPISSKKFLANSHKEVYKYLYNKFGNPDITYSENIQYFINKPQTVRKIYKNFRKTKTTILTHFWLIQIKDKSFLLDLFLRFDMVAFTITPLKNKNDFYHKVKKNIKYKMRFFESKEVNIFLGKKNIKHIKEIKP